MNRARFTGRSHKKLGWSKLITDGALEKNLKDILWGFYNFNGTCPILVAETKASTTGLNTYSAYVEKIRQ